MKNTARIVAVFAFCALALCGCSEKKAQDTQEAETEQEEVVSQAVETIRYAKIGGTMIYSGWTLYLENDEGKMIASAETRAGDIVEVYCEGEDGTTPVEKEAIRRLQNGKEEPLTFVRVSFDDEDYWTRPIFVAKPAQPGTMTKSGRLFSASDMATMTKTVVEEGTLLAVTPSEGENDFACVYVYDGNPYGKKMYVQRESISTYVYDVEKYAALARMEELGDKLKPEVRDELNHLVSEEFSYKYGKDDFTDSTKKHGTMLRNGGSLKKQTASGMEWAAEIPVGAEFEILSQEPVTADWVWKGGSSKDRTFYKVRYQGKDYFVLTNECTIGGQCAVIVGDTVLYDKDRFSTFRNELLERGTLVVCTGRMSDSLNTYLREIMFYDPNASVIRTRWIWGANSSTLKDDVKAAQLVKLAQTTKDDDMRREYLSLASGLSVSRAIHEYIVETEELLFPPQITFTTVPSTYYGNINSDDDSAVNVRDAPKTGEVVGKVYKGNRFSCDMMTEQEDTIGGVTAQWFHVKVSTDEGEISGWVFGEFLDFQ